MATQPIPRPTAPRLAPITDPPPEVAELLEGALSRNGQPLNIFSTLAYHPKLLKRFNQFGGMLLARGVLPAREREVVILRVGWRCQSVYEFGQHTLMGRQAGLSDDEIVALTRPVDEGGWSEADRLLVTLADELCDDNCVSDATWDRLAEHWAPDALVELVVVAGFYRLVSGFLNSTGVQLDDGVPGWPAS